MGKEGLSRQVTADADERRRKICAATFQRLVERTHIN